MIKECIPFFGREKKFVALIRLQHKLLPRHKTLSFLVNSYIYYKYHCDISASANIHESVRFPHPIGIVIGNGVSIGPNCSIYQNVTLGGVERNNMFSYPRIDSNVIIYPNSAVIGHVNVRQGSIIGAGSVVTKDTKINSVNYGVAASCHRVHD